MGSFYTKNNSGAILLANQDITAATGTAEAAFGEHHQQRTVGLHLIAPARFLSIVRNG